ncbi:hypothetical protein Gferi_12025 [Geosporobacter ferrireducens]|uniref:Uncharacterized protein n=1 Tax=Geosporobacter ferrireducens TaxID=1424294 RepID=A0A1D8GH91_9FIRM|nr:hypothetical protein Gferi_12025 [Geosporobacter ferrireducens]
MLLCIVHAACGYRFPKRGKLHKISLRIHKYAEMGPCSLKAILALFIKILEEGGKKNGKSKSTEHKEKRTF